MKSKILELILLVLIKPLSLILRVDKKKIIFGAMYGAYYGDNSMYLYNWILQHRRDLNPIWVTRSTAVYNQLRNENKPVTKAKSLGGIFHLLTANIGVFSNSLHDLTWNYKKIPETISLIALRHGRSVKKIRFAREGHKLSEKERKERIFESKRLRYVISTSEFISDLQEECLKVGRDKHIVTGYPRNDELYNPKITNEEKLNSFLGDLKPDKIILYGPSWRHKRYPTKFFPFEDFNSEQLKGFLEKNNYLLLLRPHRNEFNKYPELVEFLSKLSESSEMIKLCTHDIFPDVNILLPFTDVLVSDYSALYHDFLLLDRPILFVPYDHDDFKKQNGFLYDYYKYLPGPNIGSFEMFCQELENVSNDVDSYKNKRETLRNKIHSFQDANSCGRVTNLIDTIIENGTK